MQQQKSFLDTHAIGVDIGGTKILSVRMASDGNVLAWDERPTYIASADALLDAITESIIGLAGTAPPIAFPVGIGIAGRVHVGCVSSARLPFPADFPLRDVLAARLGTTVFINNDATCAAIAEAYDGAAQGAVSSCTVTIGTGVGAGIVGLNGRPWHGAQGLAGEFGHLPVPFGSHAEKVSCTWCHQKGCVDVSVGGTGFSILAKEMMGNSLSPIEIAENARASDSDAIAVIDRYAAVLAHSLLILIYTVDPEVIVLGGGISHLPNLLSRVQKCLNSDAAVKLRTTIKLSHHGSRAGAIGAARLCYCDK